MYTINILNIFHIITFAYHTWWYTHRILSYTHITLGDNHIIYYYISYQHIHIWYLMIHISHMFNILIYLFIDLLSWKIHHFAVRFLIRFFCFDLTLTCWYFNHSLILYPMPLAVLTKSSHSQQNILKLRHAGIPSFNRKNKN